MNLPGPSKPRKARTSSAGVHLVERTSAEARLQRARQRSRRGSPIRRRSSRYAPALVTAGGPLTNSVIVQRRGQSLVLHYQLIGAGGETYRPRARIGWRTAALRDLPGERLLESGHFEFG
jgi:hypothetical protein